MDPSRRDVRKPFPPGPGWEQMEIIILESKKVTEIPVTRAVLAISE